MASLSQYYSYPRKACGACDIAPSGDVRLDKFLEACGRAGPAGSRHSLGGQTCLARRHRSRPDLEGTVFDSEMIDGMSTAPTEACESLGLKVEDDVATRLVAMRIILSYCQPSKINEL
jgi:hypothetical protein